MNALVCAVYDECVLSGFASRPVAVIQAARSHRSRRTRPSKTVDEYLATLKKQGLPQTVAFLRKHESDV